MPHFIDSTATGLSRREMLGRVGTGLGVLGLAGLLADADELQAAAPPVPAGKNPLAPKKPHFQARAKHIIHLFMNGGPSQVDTFDPKPALTKYNGQKPPAPDLKTERRTGGLMMSPFKFDRYGQSGHRGQRALPAGREVRRRICA